MVVISQICGLEAEKAMNVSKTGQPTHIDWPIYLSANFFVLSPQNGVLKPAARRLFPFLSRPAKLAGQHIDRPDAVCIRAAFFSGAICLP